MLVLTRRQDQSIMIGDDIEIKILEVHEGHVRLGVTAPREIPVHRQEVYIVIQEENVLAASAGTGLADLEGLLKRDPGASSSSSEKAP